MLEGLNWQQREGRDTRESLRLRSYHTPLATLTYVRGEGGSITEGRILSVDPFLGLSIDNVFNSLHSVQGVPADDITALHGLKDGFFLLTGEEPRNTVLTYLFVPPAERTAVAASLNDKKSTDERVTAIWKSLYGKSL